MYITQPTIRSRHTARARNLCRVSSILDPPRSHIPSAPDNSSSVRNATLHAGASPPHTSSLSVSSGIHLRTSIPHHVLLDRHPGFASDSPAATSARVSCRLRAALSILVDPFCPSVSDCTFTVPRAARDSSDAAIDA
ncbi:hypothetical protein NUW54_g6222 [Trametes sanguinea]|uniref:Uncharacterized protein n=1 Tax=Trametes sanguinea TaxID=158606 RepID=A0ACC1PVF4_9APHY|nr:hypothetical protein NUW54_g6222 [Trametes sanguinea]